MKFSYESNTLKKINRQLWLLGMFKIRMLGYVGPKVVEISKEKVILKIKLSRRSRNHLGSMYLGALVVGADLVAGLPYAYLATENKVKFSLAFKNLSSQYHRRPDSDVFFEVKDLSIFENLLEQGIASKERITKDIAVKAFVHYGKPEEVHVADFVMGLSVKVK